MRSLPNSNAGVSSIPRSCRFICHQLIYDNPTEANRPFRDPCSHLRQWMTLVRRRLLSVGLRWHFRYTTGEMGRRYACTRSYFNVNIQHPEGRVHRPTTHRRRWTHLALPWIRGVSPQFETAIGGGILPKPNQCLSCSDPAPRLAVYCLRKQTCARNCFCAGSYPLVRRVSEGGRLCASQGSSKLTFPRRR